jgi:lysophospholipase L1-like esterase
MLVALMVCAGIGEGVMRVFFADRIPIIPRYHEAATYGDITIRRLRPNTTFWHTTSDGRFKFVTNAQGFRDTRNYAYEKPDGLLRVIAVGDSNTQGFEVRQNRTFPAVIEQYLRRRDVNVEVLNAGISGFSTAEELAFLENEGIKYRPDAVIVGFFANDFEDNIKANLFALEDGQLVRKKTTHAPGVRILKIVNAVAPLRWLSENSYLYSIAMNTTWELAKQLLLKKSEAALRTEHTIASEELDDYKKRLEVRLLQRMHAFCRQNGIRLILLDIPSIGKTAGSIESSIPPDLLAEFKASCDRLILGEQELDDYRGLVDFHTGGTEHINEFSHLILGMAAARALLDR